MKALSVDDIRVGDIVTIFRGPTHQRYHEELKDGQLAVVVRAHEDKSWQGLVLEVLCIDLPFVVAQSVATSGARWKRLEPHPFDTREGWTFARVSREYADSLGCVIDWTKQTSDIGTEDAA